MGFAPLQQAILDCLRERRDGLVTLQDLIDAAYGKSPDGGPLYAEDNIRVTIHHMRKKGIQIEHRSGYRLVGRGHAS